VRKNISDKRTGHTIRIEDAVPECGEDFCDTCGDCLDCYAEDRCCHNEDGEHMWVEYQEAEA